jgi:cytochrome c551/c552
MSKRTALILGGVIGLPIVLFLAIQLIPVWLLQNNPPVVAEPAWDSPETRALAQRACFDCHSNETVWPWYSRVAPVSWLITFDTIRGRRHLNFSEWEAGSGESRDAREVVETIEEGKMPPSNYLPLHPEAQLTEAEKQQLIAGLQDSLR